MAAGREPSECLLPGTQRARCWFFDLRSGGQKTVMVDHGGTPAPWSESEIDALAGSIADMAGWTTVRGKTIRLV